MPLSAIFATTAWNSNDFHRAISSRRGKSHPYGGHFFRTSCASPRTLSIRHYVFGGFLTGLSLVKSSGSTSASASRSACYNRTASLRSTHRHARRRPDSRSYATLAGHGATRYFYCAIASSRNG